MLRTIPWNFKYKEPRSEGGEEEEEEERDEYVVVF